MGHRPPPDATPGSRSQRTLTFAWSWRGTPVPVRYDAPSSSDAPPVLMLPAMSTVSTRAELHALAQHLGSWRTIVTDWPGFGDSPRPPIDYDVDLARRFLEDLVAHLRQAFGPSPLAVIACGHAAGYAIDLEGRHPGTFGALVLVAPTWRGPLPTMMNGRKPVHTRIRKLIHAPVMGEALYRLNVSKPVVRMMYRRHVFADPGFLSEDLLNDRMRLTRNEGARFASACFVTGALDPFPDRETFLAAARKVGAPILVLDGADTPPKSKAEMDALAALPRVRHRRLDRGALGLAEERASELAPLIQGFLEDVARAPAAPQPQRA